MWDALKRIAGLNEGDGASDRLKTAIEHHQKGRLSKAEALYKQALQERPDEPNALHLLGVLTAQNGDGERGIDLVGRAIALRPENHAYRANRAKILSDVGRIDESISEYEEALRLGSNYAEVHFGLGIALLRKGRIEEAARSLSQAARLNPDGEEIRMQLGIALCQMNRPDVAAEHFRAVLRMRPEHSDAHNNLGVALRSQGRSDEAAECFYQALKFNPESTRAHVNLGDTYALLGRLGDAVGHYQSALRLEPDNADVHFSLGNALAADGQLQEAAESFRKVVSIDSGRAKAYCNLGLALHQLGSLEDAELNLRRAVELAPEDGDLVANLRMIADGMVPMWHFSMMNDAERNAAYEGAVVKVVRAGDHVLDIGTGAGLLSMIAARAGAGRVTTCEVVKPIAAKARQIIDKNGYGDRITVIGKNSSELRIPDDMPGRADLLIAEIVSSELLGEGILKTFEDAKDRLLKPGARIVPSNASIVGQLAGSGELDRYVKVGSVAGFNLEDFNEFMPVRLYPDELDVRLDLYSAPFGIFDFDFQGRHHFPAERKAVSVTVTGSGTCYGVLQWIRLELGGGVRFENSPDNPKYMGRSGHWRQILYTFSAPIPVEIGQVVRLVAAHNRRNLIFHLD